MDIRPLGAMQIGGGTPSMAGGRRGSDASRAGDTVSLGNHDRGIADLYTGKLLVKITGAVELTSGEFDSSAGF